MTKKDSVLGYENWHWLWAASIFFLIMLTVAFCFALPLRDGDVWWHILYGQYFVDNFTIIPDHTLFTWSPINVEFIYCSWFSEIVLYYLYKLGQLPALFAFRYFCVFLFVFAAWRYARFLTVARHPVFWLTCLLGVLMSHQGIYAKPEIFSYALMTLMVWNWWQLRAATECSWWYCYFFPLIIVVWVNSHGGVIFGEMFLVVCFFSEVLNRYFCPENALHRKVGRHFYIAFMLSIFAFLVNPYGWRYPWQLMNFVIPSKQNLDYINVIAAYNSPFDTLGGTIPPFAVFANLSAVILVILFVQNLRAKKLEFSIVLTNLVFAVLYTKFMRTTFYWAPVFVFSASYLLASTARCSHVAEKWKKVGLGVVTVIISLCLVSRYIYESKCIPEAYQWMGFGISELQPVEEAKYIKANFPKQNIGNTYGLGAYLIWESWPESKVLVDSRHFPFKKWVDEIFAFEAGKNVNSFLEKYRSDLWCISLGLPRTWYWFLKSPEWELAFYGKSAAVFVRKGVLVNTHRQSVGSLHTINNALTAVNALSFALTIGDLDSAGVVVERIKSTFRYPSQKKLRSGVPIILAGYSAYYGGDYRRAAELLDSIYPHLIKNETILAYSLIMAAEDVYRKEDVAQAFLLVERAWAVLPYSPYTVYNNGVLKWFLEVGNGSETTWNGQVEGNGGGVSWRKYLETFVNNAELLDGGETYLAIAKAILAGRYDSRPDLMLPPIQNNNL